MLDKNRKLPDFLQDFTKIQMLQYQGSKRKEDRNFVLPVSQSVMRNNVTESASVETFSDGIMDIIDETINDDQAQ